MKWTQLQAAEALDVHSRTISNYECGTTIPKVVKLATERLKDIQKIAA